MTQLRGRLVKGSFSHGRPAEYFASNIGKLSDHISAETKQHFEQAFEALNGLL